jgi:HAE1 family hydrophobic/amphiphilic exporter-1
VLAVFLPIAFMQGLVGRFFFEYGLVISFAVGISLLVALTLTPMLCAYTLRSETSSGGIYQTFERLYQALDRAYGILLIHALRHRALVFGLALASIYLGISAAQSIPLELSSKADRSEFEAIPDRPQSHMNSGSLVACYLAV